MARNLQFSTSISGHTTRGNELRGTPLGELIDQSDFVSVIFLSITGKLPSAAQKRLCNAVLVACIDHGLQPASGFVPRVVAASGNPILPSMASCLLALGPAHGGAITGAMRVFEQIEAGEDVEQAALDLIKQYRADKKRVPGFGHPVYTDVDPRAVQLFALARELGVSELYLNIARTVETHLEQELARKLVLNIDGALAAILLTLGIPVQAGDGIFGLARVAGSIAHIVEEQQQHNSVRRLPDDAVEYVPSNKV